MTANLPRPSDRGARSFTATWGLGDAQCTIDKLRRLSHSGNRGARSFTEAIGVPVKLYKIGGDYAQCDLKAQSVRHSDSGGVEEDNSTPVNIFVFGDEVQHVLCRHLRPASSLSLPRINVGAWQGP